MFVKNKKGFTLIELLVAVSIMSLLSSIMFSSLKEARIKTENTKINALIVQYRNALELFRDAVGYYPNFTTSTRCLGDYNNPVFGNRCGSKQSAGATGNPASGPPETISPNSLRLGLLTYFPSFPSVSDIITPAQWDPDALYQWLGATYTYNSVTRISRIAWNLRGLNQSCGPGLVAGGGTVPTGSYTACYLNLGPP